MKKLIALILVCMLSLSGCADKTAETAKVIEGNLQAYREMSDGTWECDGHSYKYRLEISGTMNNAAKSSTFVYLSNLESITFEQAWRAAGFSSNTEDYFSVEEAVLVDMQ